MDGIDMVSVIKSASFPGLSQKKPGSVHSAGTRHGGYEPSGSGAVPFIMKTRRAPGCTMVSGVVSKSCIQAVPS